MKDKVLVYSHVHDYAVPLSDVKLRTIVNQYRQYFEQYSITHVIIKIPIPSRRTAPIKLLIRRLEEMAKKYNCAYDFTTAGELKDNFVLHSTDEIPEWTTKLYPQLSGLYKKGEASKHSFYKKMYEAVLAAYTYSERIRIPKLKK